MKRNHFLLAASLLSITACSTYKQTQTPDDVYYSPGTQQEELASNSSSPNNGEYYSTPNDQYIRLKAQDPNRWSYFDDYSTDYYGGYGGYSPMAYGASAFGYYGSMGWGMSPWIGFSYWSPMTYWNSYYTWNGFYNPYYGGIIVTNPKIGNTGTVTRLSTFNPSSYANNNYNRGNTRPSTAAYTPYNYSQTIRRSYTANSFNTNNPRQSYYRPATNNNSTLSNQNRTYTPRSSSSFGGSSGGGGGGSRGGGGGVSRPGR
jgi:hypothetical protein